MNHLANLSNLGSLLDKQIITKVSQIDINLLEEDAQNARTEFNDDTIEELCQSIISQGVVSPISVRKHPIDKDKYVINHGHRRVRAAKKAGLTKIPAFLDDNINTIGKFLENIQREDLSPMDIAKQLKTFTDEGLTNKDIALSLGKSDSWVSRHLGLLDAPEVIQEALDDGRLTSVEAARTLVSLSEEHESAVEDLLSTTQTVTQKQVREFARDIQQTADDAAAGASNDVFDDEVSSVSSISDDTKPLQIKASNIKKDKSDVGELIVEMVKSLSLYEEKKLELLELIEGNNDFGAEFNPLRNFLKQLDLKI